MILHFFFIALALVAMAEDPKKERVTYQEVGVVKQKEGGVSAGLFPLLYHISK